MSRLLSLPLSLAVGIAVLSGGWSATAATSIKVLVNDEPITSYDIAQRLKLMQVAREKGGAKEATEELINEVIQLQEAKKRGFDVPDKQVDAFFANIAQKSKLTVAQFNQALASTGISPATLKRRIKAQASWNQLVQGKTRATAKVKPSDVIAAMFEKRDRAAALTITEYKLQQIVFIVPADKKSSAYSAQRRREAEAFRGRFGGCDKSIAMAKTLKDVVVIDLGRRDTTQLDGRQGEDIQQTAVGKTTPPMESPRGFELIAVCDSKEVRSDAVVRGETESKMMMEKAKGVGEEYLKELKKAAIIVYR